MHFTFRQLQIFESVARHLNFSRASEELHLTQPAVSMQIKQLEDLAGLPLFEHMGKRIFLTHAGKELFEHTRIIAKQMKEAREALESTHFLNQNKRVNFKVRPSINGTKSIG